MNHMISKINISNLFCIAMAFGILNQCAFPIGDIPIPIYFISLTLFLFVYVFLLPQKFYYKIIQFFKTKAGIVLCCSFLLLFNNPYIDISKTSFSRIFATFNNLTNFAGLIVAEPSFSTHISRHIFSFLVFLKYPFIGIGYGNSGSILTSITLNSGIPLTPEIYRQTIEFDILGGSSSFLFKSLAETGILGTILLFLFCCILVKNSFLIINKLNEINRSLLIGVIYSVIIILLFSFYDTFFVSIIWFYVGLLQAFIIFYKNQEKFNAKKCIHN